MKDWTSREEVVVWENPASSQLMGLERNALYKSANWGLGLTEWSSLLQLVSRRVALHVSVLRATHDSVRKT